MLGMSLVGALVLLEVIFGAVEEQTPSASCSI
jgi:hypothetical protein